jgi:hypothetical protein
MKYIGEKSLSSFLSTLLKIFWWVILAAAAIYVVIMVVNLFSINAGDPVTKGINELNMSETGENAFLFLKWGQVEGWPVAGKVVVVAYWAACIVLSLIVLKKVQQLFANFKNDIVFDGHNIQLMSTISKLLIVVGILTWSFGTLVASILLLILCQVFKHGANLQEEHDFTV